MKSSRAKLFLLIFFLLATSLALNPNLFTRGIPFDERINQNIPDRIFNVESLKGGHLPLWNPYHFFGNPHIALHQTGFFYAPNIILYGLFSPVFSAKFITFLDTFLAGLFLALYLRRLKAGFFGAAAGGFALMISAYMLCHEGHVANHNSICWVPLVFFFIEGFLQKRDRWNFAGGALCFTIMIFTGYMHTVIIAGFMVLAYLFFYLFWGRGRFRFRMVLSGGIVAMLAWGGLLSSIQTLTTWGFLPLTSRSGISYENFSSFFFPVSHLPMLFFPLFFGGHWQSPWAPPYMGAPNFAEISGWMGVAPVVLALFGFVLRHRGRRSYAVLSWGVVIVFSFLFCLGPQIKFYRIMYHVPLYNMFRGAAKNWMNVHLGIAVLCGLGVHSLLLISQRKPHLFRKLGTAAALLVILVGAGMMLYIISLHRSEISEWSHTKFSDVSSQIKEYISWKNPAIWMPLAVVMINGVLLAAWALKRSRYFLFALVLTLTPFAAFTKQQLYNKPANADILFKSPEKNRVFSLIQKKEERLDDFRVFPVRENYWEGNPESFYPLTNSIYKIRSLSGYGPLYINRFAAFLGLVSVGTINKPQYFIRQNLLFSLLNVKYFTVTRESQGYETFVNAFETTKTTKMLEAFPPLSTGESIPVNNHPSYRKIFDDKQIMVYENLNVLPRAYSVCRLVYIGGKRKKETAKVFTMWKMQNLDVYYDPQETAFYTEPLPPELSREFSPAEIEISPHGLNTIRARVESGGEAFVIFAEHFVPGWHCKIDGGKAPIYCANAVLMGIRVPPGTHDIELYYLPRHFVWGAIISGIMLLGLLGLLFLPKPAKNPNLKFTGI